MASSAPLPIASPFFRSIFSTTRTILALNAADLCYAFLKSGHSQPPLVTRLAAAAHPFPSPILPLYWLGILHAVQRTIRPRYPRRCGNNAMSSLIRASLTPGLVRA